MVVKRWKRPTFKMFEQIIYKDNVYRSPKAEVEVRIVSSGLFIVDKSGAVRMFMTAKDAWKAL